MLNKYTIIYRNHIAPRVLRKDITAADEQEAARLIPDGQILHVIMHEPPNPMEPQVRFLDRAFHGEDPSRGRPTEGCKLIVIHCTPETTVDEVRHELWSQVLKILDVGDTTQCDPYLLDDALNDCDVGCTDIPFDLNEWPYDKERFAIVEVSKQDNIVAVDWQARTTKVFGQRFEALEWVTKNRPEHKATLYFELWPGCSAT